MKKRIAIIGISGSGKSVYSKELARLTGLPLFHADRLWWKGKWEEVPQSEYLPLHEAWVAQDAWIIEGYVDRAMKSRLERADIILYLDYSGLRPAFRLILRWLQHRKKSRPELPAEALEKLKAGYLWRVLWRKERPGIEDALRGVVPSKLVRVRNPKELARFSELV